MIATLAKTATADGLVEVEDGVALGKKYEVDPASRRRAQMFNVTKGVHHTKEIILAREPTAKSGWGWIATELLDIPSDG